LTGSTVYSPKIRELSKLLCRDGLDIVNHCPLNDFIAARSGERARVAPETAEVDGVKEAFQGDFDVFFNSFIAERIIANSMVSVWLRDLV